MTQESKPGSWWHTMPGMLTATAGVITAVTGLVIALDQVGLLGGSGPGRGQEVAMDSSVVAEGAADPLRADAPQAGVGGGAGGGADGAPAFEPEMREVGTGELRYEVLGMATEPRNPATYALRIQVRLHNDGAYGANFWDDSFRLVIDGVPRAPVSGLNEIVDGRSAGDGEVEFIVPTGARSLVLRIHRADETVELPLLRTNR
jgi:hypothetical protein